MKHTGTTPRIILLIPPFHSHFSPMISLARAFDREGWEVVVATGEDFAGQVAAAGLRFHQAAISRNANTGIAEDTRQAASEKRRLHAFFEATFRGPEDTLLIQSRHRQEDMLSDPEGLLSQIQTLERLYHPDLWVVDQLTYGATLSLKCLALPFITFCPPHPYSIPQEEDLFGVPVRWPSPFRPDPAKLALLEKTARETNRTFAAVFNRMLTEFGRPDRVKNAFSETSPLAVIYMYPPVPEVLNREADWEMQAGRLPGKGPKSIYAGYCFEPGPLPDAWQEKIRVFRKCSPRILLSFGSFLSNRADLLGKCHQWIREAYPESGILIAAGSSERELSSFRNQQTMVEGLIPQTALYSLMDVVIHHGGCNTFTECLYYGKPMVILPFASDQFHIAADGEDMGVAAVVNPQTATDATLIPALQQMLSAVPREALAYWQQVLLSRGPAYACREAAKARERQGLSF